MKLFVTFHSVSSALMLEAAAKERGLSCAVIPVPRNLSSSCGYAAEIAPSAFSETSASGGASASDEAESAGGLEAAASLAGLLNELCVEWDAVYRRNDGGAYDLMARAE
ncbi:MAG: DUF3343 domain-containing protein [Spirochaetaceae bacterium]|jgi:hypothetical protein|nr:DUF3343 domain-containing protein [Spirochaetaceae bacterium]